MALAYLTSGIAAGSFAALYWLGAGGSLIGAFLAYTLTGQAAALTTLCALLRQRGPR